jgi:hypothetical protein
MSEQRSCLQFAAFMSSSINNILKQLIPQPTARIYQKLKHPSKSHEQNVVSILKFSCHALYMYWYGARFESRRETDCSD